MKKLDVSAIASSVGMPLKSGALVHIQAAYMEGIAEAIKGLIGSVYSSVIPYILNGLVDTVTGGTNHSITAGSVFFGGEFYYINAFAGTVPAGQFVIGNISTLYIANPASDSVTFTDGVARNIHQNRIIVLSAGTSGGGIGTNFAGWQRIASNIPQLNLTSPAGDLITVSGTYPNKVISAGALGVKVLHAGQINVGDINPSGGTSVGVSFPSAVPNTNYAIVGGTESNGTLSNDTQVVWTIDASTKSTTGFTVHFQETQAVTQNINFNWAIIAFG